jgi:FkbM family methyltransferase
MPGTILLMEPLVRRFGPTTLPIVVNDFDGDLKMELDVGELMGSHIFWYGSYSRALLRLLDRLLRPGDTLVDAGANIGEITLYAAKRVGPTGKVLAFEPMSAIADVLERNAALNHLDQVQVRRVGLSDNAGTMSIYSSTEHFRARPHDGLGTLHPGGTRTRLVEEVEVKTLDQEVTEHGVRRIDVLKVDVEGSELPLLRGAVKCLERDRPWIAIEVQEETSRSAGYAQEDILEYLEQFGYTFRRLGRRGSLIPVSRDTLGPFQNLLCTPPGRALPP